MLIAISLIFACLAAAAFWWAVRDRQYDDFELPAARVVFDEFDRVDIGQQRSERSLTSDLSNSSGG